MKTLKTTHPREDKPFGFLTNRDIATHYDNTTIYTEVKAIVGCILQCAYVQLDTFTNRDSLLMNAVKYLESSIPYYIKTNPDKVEISLVDIIKIHYNELFKLMESVIMDEQGGIYPLNQCGVGFVDLHALLRNSFYLLVREEISSSDISHYSEDQL